jgi:tetratricopeptide (TPR) repeat protein
MQQRTRKPPKAPKIVSQRSIADILRDGVAHHRADRLAEAATAYTAILIRQPRNSDALHLLGAVARQQGDLDKSARLLTQAIALDPTNALYHQNLGCTLQALGHHSEAIASYRRALTLNPGEIHSEILLAQALAQSSSPLDAIAVYDQIILRHPHYLDAYTHLATLYTQFGRTDEAIATTRLAAERAPTRWECQFNLAGALFEAGRHQEALAVYAKVVELNPRAADAYNCIGRIQHERNNYPAALAAYLHTIQIDPSHADCLSNLGALYLDQNDLKSAEIFLRETIRLRPDLLNAHSNLGTVLSRKGDFEGAVRCFHRVLSENPQHVAALCSLGFLHDARGDEPEARAYFELALAVDPTAALPNFNISTHQLAEGDFVNGWRNYERRWEVRQFVNKRKHLVEPAWRGQPDADLNGKWIYLYCEQGFGDTLQLIRYLPLVRALGAQIILEVQPALMNLLRDFPAADHVIAGGVEVPPRPFDWQCPLLSLPFAFKTSLQTIPAPIAYLHPDPTLVAQWATRIPPAPLRVGLVWSGNPEHTRDRLRSIPLPLFAEILATPGITFYSLQKGPGVAQIDNLPAEIRPINLDPHLTDFTQTAAAITHLDLVLCVDTAVAHLAGALGKPVWILLNHAPDWRWLRNRDDSPWYPKARLFRQSTPHDWTHPLADVKQALTQLAP